VVPFVLISGLLIHIAVLHVYGSGPVGGVLGRDADNNSFASHEIKDCFVVATVMLACIGLLCVSADVLHHSDNLAPVDRFATPLGCAVK